jgi:hypothetical protein
MTDERVLSDPLYQINYEKEIGEIYWKRRGFIEECEKQSDGVAFKSLEKKYTSN